MWRSAKAEPARVSVNEAVMNPLATGWIDTMVMMLGALFFFARATAFVGGVVRPIRLLNDTKQTFRTGWLARTDLDTAVPCSRPCHRVRSISLSS
jgi:hypothetical protein